jgi:hypothetical protein
MRKYEEKMGVEDFHAEGLAKKDLQISKWKSERNFYLHCFCVTLMW